MTTTERIELHLKEGSADNAIKELWILFEAVLKGASDGAFVEKVEALKGEFVLISGNYEENEKRFRIDTVSMVDYNINRNVSSAKILDVLYRLKGMVNDNSQAFDERVIEEKYEKYNMLFDVKSDTQYLNNLYSQVRLLFAFLIVFFLIASCLVSFNLYQQYRVLSQSEDINSLLLSEKHKEISLAILREAPEKLKGFREKFEKNEIIKRWYDEKNSNSLTYSEAEFLFNSCSPDTSLNPNDNVFDCNMKVNVYNLLNYMEGISSGYMNGVCDKAMIEESFKEIILNTHDFFEQLIIRVGEEPGREIKPWKPFQDFVKELKKSS